MAQQQYIKDLYENEEVSLREIVRRTKLSFQTVQKYAYKKDWGQEGLPNLEAENYPSLKEYIPTIDEWMEADRKVPRKQRIRRCGSITGWRKSWGMAEVIPVCGGTGPTRNW